MKRQRIFFLLASALLAVWSGCVPAAPVSPGTPAARPAAAPAALAADAAAGSSAGGEPTEEPARYVALTFDDGPRSDTTGRLLDGLRARGASATFFLVGEQIAANRALVERMQAEGHQVGNHSWSHAKLQGASRAAVEAEIGRTDAAIRAILGEGSYWVRPPYGLLDDSQRAWFSVPLVHWSVDPEDWKLRNTARDAAAVLADTGPGDIILMHDAVPASVDAALQVVDTLQAQGYTFVTVEELLALEHVEPQPGVLYHRADWTE